jgi:hypothetical protein
VTDKGHRLALADGEGNALHRLDPAAVLQEGHPQVLDVKKAHPAALI